MGKFVDNRKVEYRYLNMDTKEFAKSYSDLVSQLKSGNGATIKCTGHPRDRIMRYMNNDEHNQILYGGGSEYFTEQDITHLYKKLSATPK